MKSENILNLEVLKRNLENKILFKTCKRLLIKKLCNKKSLKLWLKKHSCQFEVDKLFKFVKQKLVILRIKNNYY